LINNQNSKSLINQNYIDHFTSKYKNILDTLLLIKADLNSHFIYLDDEFDTSVKQINFIIEKATSEHSNLNIPLILSKQSDLNESLNGLITKTKEVAVNKNEDLYSNALLLIILTGVILIAIVYFLVYKMTNGFRKLNVKLNELNDNNDTSSNVITSLDKNFELLKTKLHKLESLLEEANKISDYKSVFLSNMSYEIRTPLNSVLGMINMLKQSELTTEQQVQLEIAEYSSEHVLQLANMILDNSKVEKGKVELELSAIDLKSDLSKLVKVFEYDAWEKNLDFEFKFLADENQKFLLLGDLKRIKQILTNLLSNAIKFTNSGKVSLTIDQTVGPDDYQIVTFYIQDTGIGMAREKAKQIFTDSENNHLSIMDYYGGTGLGLTASSQLIKLMGGELKLESKENEGSIFYFSIQLKKTLNLEREKPEPSSVLLNQFDYKFNVLVAEDNKINQKVIKFLLEQQGVDCTCVKNGSEALKLFKILDFDMVFMDIFMPEMDGLEATQLIKSTEKYKKHEVPVIAVSASAFEEDIENAKNAGINHFLSKPIDTEKLKELLVKYAPKSEEK
jgi:signal transduction histidine kinase/CheY-like chemotaxis protein